MCNREDCPGQRTGEGTLVGGEGEGRQISGRG